jgi:transcriptional regulator with XRE-family HTH domain
MNGDDLQKFRQSHELTQQALAQLLGVAANTIARWERNERAIPPYLELALKGISKEKEEAKTRK